MWRSDEDEGEEEPEKLPTKKNRTAPAGKSEKPSAAKGPPSSGKQKKVSSRDGESQACAPPHDCLHMSGDGGKVEWLGGPQWHSLTADSMLRLTTTSPLALV